jgi:hypothetical protein
MVYIVEYDPSWAQEPEPSPELIRAKHLAGHAVIALAQEIEVVLLTLEPLATVEVDIAGAYLLDEGTILRFTRTRPESAMERERFAESLLRIALAGRCTELVHQDISCSIDLVKEATTDWELVCENAAVVRPDEDERLA